MDINLKGNTILITGAAGDGVGHGICDALANCGATLLINDLHPEKTKKAAERYPIAYPIIGDISESAEVKRMFVEIEKEYGVVHGLVNNAGTGMHKKAHLAEDQEYDNLFNVDVKAVWMVTRAFINQLVSYNKLGNIVNISSVHARKTVSRFAVYASAKAAVEGLTRGMAIELGQMGIRCNAVAPGYVDSSQNRTAVASWTSNPENWLEQQKNEYQSIRHLIPAQDCGNAVAFLLSDLAKSITGQTLTVDAGLSNLLYSNNFIPDNLK